MQDLFFYTSKILWLLIKPDVLFLLLLSFTLILLLIGKWRIARNLLAVLLLFAWTISLVPIGGWLHHPLDSRFPTNPDLPENIDGIIVLGGSIITRASNDWQQLETNDLADRIFHFLTLARKYPQARLVFTGGNASLSGSGTTEAEAFARLYLDLGFDPARLVLEKESRNTVENVTFSKQLVVPGPTENWLLVTSAAHMPRAVGLFCRQNWPVIPFPVDHSSRPGNALTFSMDPAGNTYGLVRAVYEWMGLTAYYLTGKIDHWLPAGCARAAE